MNTNLILILTCLLLGSVLRKAGHLPLNTPKVLNGFIIHITLPAIVLAQIPKLLGETSWNFDSLIPISMAWIIFLISVVLFSRLGSQLKWTKAETGTIVLTAGLANTSFVGIPLLETILGAKAIPIAILIDQGGSFLVVSSLGVLYASLNAPRGESTVSFKRIAKTILTFPPFVSLMLSILIWACDLSLPAELTSVLERLGATLVPLALVAVGFQLKISREVLTRKWKPLTLGLFFRLFCSPFLCLILYRFIFRSHSFSTQVTILESAMAPMITAAVIAEEFEFDAELASLMLGVGIPLSLMTVPLWNFAIRF